MSAVHQAILYVSLVFLGLSLVFPGLTDTLRVTTGSKWLVAADVEAKGHLRGLNAMMAPSEQSHSGPAGTCQMLGLWSRRSAQ
jgi:hypothetical protein